MIHGLDGDEEETTGNNMAGYQALYGLEAVYRYKEGQNRLFDLTDAETVSEDEIQAAGEKLPELKAAEAMDDDDTDDDEW